MSTICPHCGAALVAGDRFCGDCGGAVGQATSGAPGEVAGPSSHGEPAPTPATPRESRSKKRRRSSGGRILGIVGLLAVVGAGAAWYLGYLPDSVPTWNDLRSRLGAASEGTEGGDPGSPSETGAGTQGEAGDTVPGETVQPGEPLGQRPVDAEEADPQTRVTEAEGFPVEGVPRGEVPVEEAARGEVPVEEVPRSEVPVELPRVEEGVILGEPGEELGEAFPIFFLINTEPEGARLFVDGDYLGTTPTLVTFDSVGVFRMRFDLEGRDPVTMDFDPREWGYEPGPFEDVLAITIPIGGSVSGVGSRAGPATDPSDPRGRETP